MENNVRKDLAAATRGAKLGHVHLKVSVLRPLDLALLLAEAAP